MPARPKWSTSTLNEQLGRLPQQGRARRRGHLRPDRNPIPLAGWRNRRRRQQPLDPGEIARIRRRIRPTCSSVSRHRSARSVRLVRVVRLRSAAIHSTQPQANGNSRAGELPNVLRAAARTCRARREASRRSVAGSSPNWSPTRVDWRSHGRRPAACGMGARPSTRCSRRNRLPRGASTEEGRRRRCACRPRSKSRCARHSAALVVPLGTINVLSTTCRVPNAWPGTAARSC